MTPVKQPATLGTTPAAIYAAWERAQQAWAGMLHVVGWIPGYPGVFAWHAGTLIRETPPTHAHLAYQEPASAGDLAALDWAIRHGALQIETRAYTGVDVQHARMLHPPIVPPRVLHQATGRALCGVPR